MLPFVGPNITMPLRRSIDGELAADDNEGSRPAVRVLDLSGAAPCEARDPPVKKLGTLQEAHPGVSELELR
jgi:hypothetical protein